MHPSPGKEWFVLIHPSPRCECQPGILLPAAPPMRPPSSTGQAQPKLPAGTHTPYIWVKWPKPACANQQIGTSLSFH
ncbi:hypothetical protein XENTR_v10002750 [Xenopus tropicalis]|nr:hypothetical protein XENTR_v10002750 [Xenopus tropicalis]